MLDPMPYATFSFVMSITPGPNNVMLTASGANFGFRRTLPHMFGIAAGCALQLLAVCAGFGALFHRWPVLQTVLQWAGAAYLVYLGWKLLGSGEIREAAAVEPIGFRHAVAFQFVNPKAWVMTLTAVSLFWPAELNVWAAGTYLVATMVGVNLPCIAVWALFGSSLRRWLTQPARRMGFNVVMALALAATGVIMLV
ncbi:MAG TPA: LysE family translocator [Steroidobacteraceae bacterium]|jgi:threonine/homoserine/homoserine lactone efflux protein|nr:LysE family translocator [Steroidobacteraceae bacterium]